MTKYVVLFRGINVGGHNKLPMKPLVALLEQAGFKDVSYYIQSGNIVLAADDFPQKIIVELVQEHFELTPELMILSIDEFSELYQNNPFTGHDGKIVHCFICSETPTLDEEKLVRYQAESEKVSLKNNALYLYAPNGIGRSKLAANMEACLGVSATARNLNTLNKINELLG